MKYLIFCDGYHDNIIVNSNNEVMDSSDLLRRLALPHNDSIGIGLLDYEVMSEDPAIPEEVMNSCVKIGENYQFSEREFNGMWFFSQKLSKEDN